VGSVNPRAKTRAMRARSSGPFSFEFSGVTFSGGLPSLMIHSAGASQAGSTISGSIPNRPAIPFSSLSVSSGPAPVCAVSSAVRSGFFQIGLPSWRQ